MHILVTSGCIGIGNQNAMNNSVSICHGLHILEKIILTVVYIAVVLVTVILYEFRWYNERYWNINIKDFIKLTLTTNMRL